MTYTTTTHIFFFNDTATTEIYTLSLHDALPIYVGAVERLLGRGDHRICDQPGEHERRQADQQVPSRSSAHPEHCACIRPDRSEEHTSELQSRQYLVCRLLLEKKKHRPLPALQPR